MRLLIVKMSSIGDVVQALCVLGPLRPLCSHLGWVTEAPALPLLEGHPLIERVHLFPKERLRAALREGLRGRLGAGRRELAALRGELHAEGYDTVLDMQGLAKSALVVGLSGARRRVGFAAGRELASLALNERVACGRMERHAVLKYLDLARRLGAKVDRVGFPLAVRPEERARVAGLLAQDPRPLVVVCPQARWESKLWPAERFAALTRSLVGELGVRVALCGAPADRQHCEAIRRQAGPEAAGRTLNLAGELGLREFAELCRLSRLAVTCDTGPMHLAAAVGAPVVAVFGPTAPWRTGPFGSPHRIVRKGLTCSPCFRRSCDSMACMSEVSAEEVLAAARQALERGRSVGPTAGDRP